jgi:hypothetical protein
MTALALVAVIVGCQGTEPAGKEGGGKEAKPEVLAEGKKMILPSEPAGAKGVAELKKSAKDGDEVVMAAQIGGVSRPFVTGRASMVVVDPSLKPAMECSCPWDFCESDPQELADGKALVKFVDGKGEPLAAGARELFGLRELSEVVVKGKASRDDQGNLTVLATGIFIRKAKP